MKKLFAMLMVFAMVLTAGSAFADAADGVYTVSTTGHNGPLSIDVTIKDNAIADITVTDCVETVGIGDAAFSLLREDILENQTTNVDFISGATVSSAVYLAAVNSALEQAGAAAGDFDQPVPAKAAQSTSLSCDVLVIGGGLAGVVTAIEAGERGADVILLEKNEIFGGASARSEGWFAAAGTDMQKELGYEDSPEHMAAEMEVVALRDIIDREWVREISLSSNDSFNWLRSHGVSFNGIFLDSSFTETTRVHTMEGSGAQMMVSLTERMKTLPNIHVCMGTAATELMTENNAVIGANATNKAGDLITVTADHVMLATGGMANNPELFGQMNPYVGSYIAMNPGTGDGYLMAKAIGADTIDTMDGLIINMYMLGGPADVSPYLAVTLNGARYCNESAKIFEKSGWLNEAGYGRGYVILDQAQYEQYQADIDVGLSCAKAFTGATIEELAEAAGMDKAVFADTFTRYQTLCASGEDIDFNKPAEYMIPYGEGPYYALLNEPALYEAYAGVRIDHDAHVLNVDGEIIPGLYAAGGVAMAHVTDFRYLGSGSSLLNCTVTALRAVEDMME